jgi:AraC-like DNA-binding protein
MEVTAMRALVRSASLNGYVSLARSLRLDAARLMRSVGLDPADVAAPDSWVSAAAVARLLDVSAARSGEPSFAIRLAERRRLTTLGPLSVVLREEPDLRSALLLLIRYEHVYNQALHMRLEESERTATIRLWFEFGEPAPGGQALALGVAALHGIILECVGPHWRPLAVCFQGAAPADLSTLRDVFGPGLRFEHDFTGLVLRASDLNAKNALSDPHMRPHAQRFLDSLVAPRSVSTTDRVKEIVELLLPVGKCSMDQVARTLGMDRRTLHRHLAREGTSFSAILHATRKRLAERHLATDSHAIADVAHLLGFAAPSAFCRWFHQQFRVTPTEWRRISMAAAAAHEQPPAAWIPAQVSQRQVDDVPAPTG